jgi:TetR/AcrR family transcriptional regulator, cholesterol catabolism regulator
MAGTRDQLLAEAARVFAAKGYAAASVQEIADAVGIRKPSVYKHFRSKEDLLLGNLELGHALREAAIAEISALDATPLEKIREYLRSYVVRMLEEPDLTAVFIREQGALTEPHLSADRQRRRKNRHILRDLIVDCQTGGDADPRIDPQLTASYLWGAVNATPEWYRQDGPEPVDTVAKAIANLGATVVTAGRPVAADSSGDDARPDRSVRPREFRSRRDTINDVALRIIRAKGFAATTVEGVAAEVGVLKGSMYHYIGSKDELLIRIFETAHLELTTIIGTVAQLDATPAAQVRELARLQARWFLENPDQAVVLFSEWPFLTGGHREIVVGRRKDLERFVRRLLEQAQMAGEIDPELDIRRTLRFVLGAVNAVCSWYRPGGPHSPSHIAAAYAELTAGLLAGVPSPS